MKRTLHVGILLILLTIFLGTSFLFLVQPDDPLAKFRTPDGGFSFPGGKFTPEIQQLLFGPKPGPTTEWTVWQPKQAAYSTIEYVSRKFSVPNLNVYVPQPREAPVDLSEFFVLDGFQPLIDAVHSFFSFDWLVGRARAAVVFDAVVELERTLTTDPQTWSHNPVGTPRGVIVLIGHGTESTDCIVSVSYAGIAMTRVNTATDTATEPGGVYLYFLGASIPVDDPATVSADISAGGSCNGTDMHFVSMSFTAALDTEVIASATDAENQANPTATLAYSGRTSIAAMMFYSGIATPPGTTACSGSSTCTLGPTFDIAAFGTSSAYQTTAGSTDQVMGWTSANDDVAVVYAAISELVAQTNWFLVLGDADCTVTTIATDAGCWAATSGGAAPTTVPTTGSNVFMDGASGAGTGTLDASLNITTGTYSSALFLGTFAIVTFTFQNTGTFTHSAGTITLSTGALDTGVATVSASITTSGAASLTFDGLTISGSTIAKGTASLTVQGGLTMSGGDLTSTSGTVSVTGNVNISFTISAIDFGSEAWTVSGTWANASTDSTVWEAGSGTMTFDSATGGTMTFAGVNLAEAELNNVTFNSTAGTVQTFTMATRSLRIGATLTVTDSVSTTTLNTANLNVQANIIDVLASGILLCGTGDLIGLVTLNVDGSMTMDTIVVANIFMNRTAGTGTIDVTLWTAFVVGANVDVRWTFSPSVAGDTWQFVLEDVTAATSYDLLRNAIVIDTQTSVGTVVTLSRVAGWAAGDAMAIDEPSACGTDRYWILGTGNWSATANWSSTSGGAGGCSVPVSTNPVFIDIASCSAACTITVDVNAAMSGFDSTGFDDASSTLAVQTFNFAVSGNVTLAANPLLVTIGDSTTNGFTATGTLTMSGGSIGCGVAACNGDIDGNVNISAVGSRIDFGSDTWLFGGTWTNATTSASWDAGTSTVIFDAAVAGTMTFAGANLTEAEFNSVTFTSSAGTAQTFTMATLGLRWLTTLTVSDTVSTTALATANLTLGATADASDIIIGNGGILTANASTVRINGFTMTGGTSGTLTITTGTWEISGNWNSSGAGSTFTQGTGVHFFDAAATITLLSTDNTFDDLSIRAGASTLGSAVVVTVTLGVSTTGLGGTLNTSAASSFAVTANSVIVGAGGILTANASTITVNGNWDSGAGTFTVGTSTVSIGATATITSMTTSSFFNLTITTGTTTPSNSIDIDNTFTISGGTYAKGTTILNVDAGLTMSGGDLTSTSGAVTIAGAVNISSSASAIDFGSEAWTVSGTWTNASTDAAVWEAGTGTILFASATGGTMTFAGANLAEAEFSSVTFTSSAGTAQTFTMATRGLRWGGTLTITDTSGGTTLAKATLGLTGGALTISGSAASGLTSTSGDATVTTVSISTATAFIDLGSESWTVSDTWTNETTSASWDAGTGTVTFDDATAGTMTFAGVNLAEDEFSGVTFNSTGGTAQIFTMDLRGLRLGGTLTVSDSVSTTNLTTSGLAVTAGAVTIGAGGILTMGASTITVNGNWNSSAGSIVRGTSTVVFAATGGLTMVANNISEALYNMTVNLAVMLTNNTNNAWVANVLTVNGTILSAASDPQLVLFVSGESGSNMLVLGGSADVDDSGYLILRGRGPGGTTYTVPAAVYEHLGLQAGNSTFAYTFNLAGNISTPLCGVYNECAIIITSEATLTPASQLTFNTMNFSITAGGTLWLGDGTTTGGTFNMGSSAIDAFGFNPTGDNIVVNLQTSTLTIHPSSVDDPIAFYTTESAQVFGNTASVTIHGQLRLGRGLATNTSFINAGGSTWTVTDNEGTVTGLGAPGECNIVRAGNYIIFGTSTWTCEGRWTNNSTSSLWDAGTATTVTLNAGRTGTLNTDHYFGCTILGEDEFFNLTIRTTNIGTPVTITMLNDSPGNGCIDIAGTLTVSDDVSTTTLATNNLSINAGALIIGNGGILTANASAVTVPSVTMTGGTSGVITVTTGVWAVSGNWNTGGVGSIYTQGTGIVTFSATATITMLATDNVFDDLTISGGTVTLASAIVVTNIVTVSGGSFDTATLNITIGQIILNSPGTMSLSGDVLGFTRFEMNASYTHDGVTVSVTFTLTVNVGTMDLTQMQSGSSTEVAWTLNPNTAGATFTAAMGGMTANTSYDMFRDDILVQTLTTDASGNATFAVTGGWSPHSVSIQPSPVGGGGAGGQEELLPPTISGARTIIIVIAAIFIFAVTGSMADKRRKRNRRRGR